MTITTQRPVRQQETTTTAPRGGPATYTVPEVGELLGVGTSTVYQMLRSGELPARRAGDRWIISRRRVLAWLDGDDQAAPADASPAGGTR